MILLVSYLVDCTLTSLTDFFRYPPAFLLWYQIGHTEQFRVKKYLYSSTWDTR